jgi:hypothetical protein
VTEASPPLPIEAVDLESLVLARNDGHPDGDWWFNPRTGESLYHGIDDDSDVPALVRGVHVLVPHEPQPAEDVDDFIAGLDDEAEAVRLYAAFHRRGGLRRFRELVARGPHGARWQELTMRREAVRAIDWLLERDLVDRGSALARRAELEA